jgi:eukaryotic-like serine/threonine-protein kinase
MGDVPDRLDCDSMSSDRFKSIASHDERDDMLIGDSTLDSDMLRASELLLQFENVQRLQNAPGPSRASFSNVDDANLPTFIGRYKIVGLLGSGGCGVVYHGVDVTLNRDVAVKIPLPFRSSTEALRSKFLREAQSAAKLDHPNIVPIFEASQDIDSPYIAYAYCSGPTLSVWLRENGPCDPILAANLVYRLADAIQYSHDSGILHRDIKPGNVLLFPQLVEQADGLPFSPRLSDFGLATLLEASTRETFSSTIMGTPMYMAPETLDSPRKPVGPEADVFGLGGILFESITGQPPFKGETVLEVLDKVRTGSIPRVRSIRPLVPRDLAIICEKSLAIQPEDRYRSPGDLKADLLRYLRHERISAKPLGFAAQVNRMSRDYSRVGEAVGYVAICHTAMMLWVAYWPICIFFQLGDTHSMTIRDSMPDAIPLIVVHVVSIYLGWRMARRHVWAAISLAVSGLLLTIFQIGVLSRWITPPFSGVYADARLRDIVFSLVFFLFAMQSILCAFAWRALSYHSTRKFLRY